MFLLSVPPDPVTQVEIISITTDMAILSWSLGFNGHARISEVQILYQTEENFRLMVSNTVIVQEEGNGVLPTQADLTGLEPHTLYSFSVSAVNDAGPSMPVIIYNWTLPLREFEESSRNSCMCYMIHPS